MEREVKLRIGLGATFIIGFQILLVVAAVLLVFGNSSVANRFAEYALYLLAIGIAIQAVSLMLERRRSVRATMEGTTGSAS